MKNLKQLRLSLWKYRGKNLIITKILNLILNILTFLLSLKTLNNKKKCDILFVVTSDFQFSKLNSFYKSLSKKYNVCSLFKESRLHIIKKRNLILKNNKFHFFLFDECYANYIVTKFNPKIIITQLDGDPLIYFLKKNLSQKNSYLINIAHAISRTSLASSIVDYHYYFLFGRSSILNIKKNKKIYGSCKAMLTGRFDEINYKKIKKNKKNKKIIFFSQYLGEHKNYFNNEKIKAFKLIEEWALKFNKNVYIKLHPFEDKSYWLNVSKRNKNIFVLNSKTTMKQAVSQTQLGLILWSNASIDLALSDIPFICINPSKLNIGENYLRLEKFFGKKCASARDINNKINFIKTNPDIYKSQNKNFLYFHLSNTSYKKTLVYSQKIIEKILQGKKVKNSIELKGLNIDY